MKQSKAFAAEKSIPDRLAKRVFLIALAGVVACVVAIIALMSTMN